MKTRFTKWLLPLLVSVAGLLTTSACVVHTQPVDNVYVSSGAPAHVYYGGRDLYYRTDGYYYYDRGSWLIAPAVPSYVATYHRPVYRPSYSSRPTYQGSYTRPLHVTGSRPSYTPRPSYNSRPTYSSRPTTTTRPNYNSRPTTTTRPSAGPTHVTRPSSGGATRPPSSSAPPRRVTRQ